MQWGLRIGRLLNDNRKIIAAAACYPMHMQLAYSIIIPAYNEEHSVARAIREIRDVFNALDQSFEIIVVDDGSQDQTATVVRELMRDETPLRLVQHPTNIGKGAAVKTGVTNAQGELLFFLDCDLATHPNEAPAFISALHANTADLVIGSRRVAGTQILVSQPRHRVLLGQLFNTLMRAHLRLPYTDTQCGFKLFTRRAAQIIFQDLQTNGWTFDVELLLRARKAGLRIIEMPVTWRDGKESRLGLRDTWKILKELHRLRGLVG
jgi:dolichyl-phosphate beta-glucosyltransferase